MKTFVGFVSAATLASMLAAPLALAADTKADAFIQKAIEGNLAVAPMHDHEHKTSARTALLLIIGSSPMAEGIPAFFAASRFGAAQLVIMGLVFAASTIATYIALCVAGVAGLQQVSFGRFERYGEVLSGGVIALTGLAFLFIS